MSTNGFPMRRTKSGAYQYEIEPGRWVSRQRINQMRNREAHHARSAVAKGLRFGSLVKHPCAICGTTTDVEAHHPDHSRGREVVWLCPPHHIEADGERRGNRRLEGKEFQPPGQRGRPKGRKNYPKVFA